MPVNEGSQCTHFGSRREICLLSPPSITDGRTRLQTSGGRKGPMARKTFASAASTCSAAKCPKHELCPVIRQVVRAVFMPHIYENPPISGRETRKSGILFRSLPEMSHAMPDLRQDPPSSIYLSFYLSMHRKDGSVAHQFASSPPFLSSPLLSSPLSNDQRCGALPLPRASPRSPDDTACFIYRGPAWSSAVLTSGSLECVLSLDNMQGNKSRWPAMALGKKESN